MISKSLTILALFLSLQSLAQKKQNIYYIKNGAPVEDASIADYRRVIQEPDSGSKLFNLFEFYNNDMPKTVGHVSNFSKNMIYEGLIETYNENGIMIEKSNYRSGKRIGESTTFYHNGNIKRVGIYGIDSAVPKAVSKELFTLQQAYDSTGKQMVKDGNGFYKEIGENSFLEGNYLATKKDGTWKGMLGGDKYEEIYKNGIFVSGLVTFSDGKKSKYDSEEEAPEYPGGLGSFYSYLNKSIRHPTDAFDSKFKGRIFVHFQVDKTGNLTEIRLSTKVSRTIETEIIRVLEACTAWRPGKKHGIAVKTKYNVVINFGQST